MIALIQRVRRAEVRVVDGDTERVRGLHVDHELVFGRHLHGEIAGICSPQNAVDITRRLLKLFGQAAATRHRTRTNSISSFSPVESAPDLECSRCPGFTGAIGLRNEMQDQKRKRAIESSVRKRQGARIAGTKFDPRIVIAA